MTFDEFSRVVQEAFQSIPEAYRKGVEGVTTVETVETHPQLSGVVTLGECLTQAYRIRRPEELGDIHFVVVEGTDPYIQVILIQRASWRQRLRGALRSEGPVVLESRATARPADVGGAEGSQA